MSEIQSNRKNKIKMILLDPKTFLVFLTLVDLIFTALHINHRWREAIENGLDIVSAAPFYINPLLLFLACIAIRTNRGWGRVVGMLGSGWVIKRILQFWASLPLYYEPDKMFSWGILDAWWKYFPTTRWDIPRLGLAIIVFLYAMFLLIQGLVKSRNLLRMR